MKRRAILATLLLIILLAMVPCVVQAKIIAVSAGRHVLALDDNGTVWTWGQDSVTLPQKVPIDNVKAIAAGGGTSFALKSDGTVWAWGYGGNGALGYGGNENQPVPVQLKDLSDVVAIATSGGNGYALKGDGTVWAWGDNRNGELGDGTYGTPESVNVPVQVSGLTDIVALGENGHYAIKKDGTVYAWGNNTFVVHPRSSFVLYGVLGDSSGPGARPTPFQVQGVSSVKQITSGTGIQYTVYLKNDGTVWGWGKNDKGQMGNGHLVEMPDYDDASVTCEQVITMPSAQAEITDVKQISATTGGYMGVVAVKNDGTVWEWGDQVEQSRESVKYGAVALPVEVHSLDHVVQVSGGSIFYIALKDDGSVWGWGHNDGLSLRASSQDKVMESPVLLFQVSDHVAASPSQSPTEALVETPTPVSSVTATPVTSSPSQEPVGSSTPSPVSPSDIQPTTSPDGSSWISGFDVALIGLAGLAIVAGVVVYLRVTRRL